MSLDFLRYTGIPEEELNAFAKDCAAIVDFVKTNAAPPEPTLRIPDPVTPGCDCDRCQQVRKELS
jgi:hypothetical protein